MTGTQDKLRGLFLAALMVLSVFAGTVALSGTAAAATNTYIQPSATNAGMSGVQYNAKGEADLSNSQDFQYVTFDTGGADITGVTASDVTIYVSDNDGSNNNTASISSVSEDSDSVLSITLSSSMNVDDTDRVVVQVEGVTNPDTGGDYTAEIDLETTTEGQDFDSWSDTYNIQASSTIQSDGIELNSNNRYWAGQDLVFKDQALENDGNENNDYYEILAVEGSGDNRDVDFQGQISLDEEGEATIDTSDREGDYILNASDDGLQSFSNGIPSDETDVAVAKFSITQQTLSVEWGDDTVNLGEDEDLEFTSNRASYTVNLSASGLDYDELETIVPDNQEASNADEFEDDDIIKVKIDGDEDIAMDFTDEIDTGTYNFTVEVTDTGVEDTASIEVRDEAEDNLGFTQTFYEEDRGDIAEVNVTLENTDEGYLNFGGEGDNYNASFFVEDGNDDGHVVVEINTYLLGKDDSPTNNNDDGSTPSGLVDVADSEDDVTVENYEVLGDGSEPVDASDYSMNLTVGSITGNEEAVATMSLLEVEQGSMNTWTAASGNFGDMNDIEDFNEDVVAEGEIAQDSTIAQNDLVVFEINQGGMFGALEDANSFKAMTNKQGMTGAPEFTFWINQTNPGANQEPKVLDWSEIDSSDYAVINDEANNTAYVTFKEADLAFNREDDIGGTVLDASDGDRFEANLTIREDSNLVDDNVSVTSNFRVVEEEYDFNTMEYEGEQMVLVESSEDAMVTGTTSVAAGTNLTIRLRSTENNLLKDDEVEVTSNGTFEAMFDMSDYEPGVNFTASIVEDDSDDSDTDGIVVEAVEETTTTEDTTTEETTTEQTTTTTAEPTTTTAEPTTEEPTTTTTTGGGPGFGVAVALVALVGAALLALRREN